MSSNDNHNEDVNQDYKDMYVKFIISLWAKKRVFDCSEKEINTPFLQKIKYVDDNSPDWVKGSAWIRKAIDEGKEVFVFNEANVPEDFKRNLENISNQPYSVVKGYLREAIKEAIKTSFQKKAEREEALSNAEKKAEMIKYLRLDTELTMILEDGFTAVQLMTSDALDRETEYMGHCIGQGNYGEGIRSGLIKIFSIRDMAGEPHATLEVRNNCVFQCKGRDNKAVAEEYLPYVQKFVMKQGFNPVLDLQNMGICKDVNGNIYDITSIPEDTVFGNLDFSGTNITDIPSNLSTCTAKSVNLENTPVETLENLPKGVNKVYCKGCRKIKYIPSYISDKTIEGLTKEEIAKCKLAWLASKDKDAKDKRAIEINIDDVTSVIKHEYEHER